MLMRGAGLPAKFAHFFRIKVGIQMKRAVLLFVSVWWLCFTQPAVSASPHINPYEVGRTYVGLGELTFDEHVKAQLIDPKASYIKFGTEKLHGRWLIGGGASLIIYDDKAPFSQQVNNQSDRGQTAHSFAGALNLFVEGGYEIPLSQKWKLALLGGYEHTVHSRRGIVNCSNCYQESIEASTQWYVQPRLLFAPSKRWFIGAGVQSYLSADARTGMWFSIGRTY